MLTGGERAVVPGFEKGAFMQPTLLVDVTNDMQRRAVRRSSDPVAVVIKFETEDEVVTHGQRRATTASAAPSGPATSTARMRVARAVRTGRMWVNTYNELPGAHARSAATRSPASAARPTR